MKKNVQKSACWKFYEKVEGGGKCLKCQNFIACRGSTSNLVKHLRRRHKNLLTSDTGLKFKKRRYSSDYEGSEGDGVAASEDQSEAIAETNSAVHTIQAYRDVNGTTFLYLQPASEGEAGVQIQNSQVQPIVTSSESISANGDIGQVAVQKDSTLIEGQAADGEAKSPEEAASRRLISVPLKNFEGSSLAGRTVLRHANRPSPMKTAPCAINKEDTFDNFGKYVASLLRSLPSKTACKLQGEIVNWILKEQMKNNDS